MTPPPGPCRHALAAMAVPARKWATRSELLSLLQRAEAYMEGCPVDEFRLDLAAREAGLSRHHFLRLFREVYGKTPYRYLVEKRIVMAKEQLASTELPIHEVAAEAGFVSSSAFARAFRKATGQTPSAYRISNIGA